jgi:hypothetical protein
VSNYFNNEIVQGWIEDYLDFYKKVEIQRKDAILVAKSKGISFCEDKFIQTLDWEERWQMDILREKIFKEIGKIINGIIFTHRFTVWENYDDLYQEAAEACLKALPKFDPNFITSSGQRATAFNYFSLTAKRCLKFYTIKNKKHRDNYDIDDYSHTMTYGDENHISESFLHDEIIQNIKRVFEANKYKKFIPLVEILQEYLEKIGEYNKRDFFRFAKSYGWSPNLIRKFLKIMVDHKESIYNNADMIHDD